MRKNLLLPTGLALPILLACACASVYVPRETVLADWPQKEIMAREMPEVSIRLTDRLLGRVKIISLLGKEITILPFPYWNVDLQKIDCEQIQLIRLIKRNSRAGRSFLSSFFIGFGTVGLIAAMTSKYDEDYQMGLAGAFSVGSVAGLLGFLIGALGDVSTTHQWRLAGAPPWQRLEALSQVMGIRP